MRRSILRAAMAALLVTMPAAAQDAMPWRLSYFPYLTGSPNDGVMGVARALWFQQADYGARVTNQREVAVEAGYSTRDAWLARADVALPMLADGWRLRARAALSRETNFGLSEVPAEFTPLARDRREAWVDVTRRLAGPLHLAVRGGVDRQSIEGNSDLLWDRYPRAEITLGAGGLDGQILPGAAIPSGDLEFTLKGWTVGAGGGVAIRVMRAAQLTITAARANDDTRWYVGSGWSW